MSGHRLGLQGGEDGPSMVIVCQGPPRCMLEGDAAMEMQIRGCAFCRRIEVLADGSERRSGPPLPDEGWPN